jgi:hypothetical protein
MCKGRDVISGGLGAHVCFGPGEYNTFAAIIGLCRHALQLLEYVMPDTGTSKDSCRPLRNLNLLCPSNIDRALSGVAEVCHIASS